MHEKDKKTIAKEAVKKVIYGGKGGPIWDSVKNVGATVSKSAKNLGYDTIDKIERGKLAPNEIPMRYQPDFVKESHVKNLPRTIGSKIGGAIGAGMGVVAKSIINPIDTTVSGIKKYKKYKKDNIDPLFEEEDKYKNSLKDTIKKYEITPDNFPTKSKKNEAGEIINPTKEDISRFNSKFRTYKPMYDRLNQ